MTPERYQRAVELFHAAAERDPATRPAFLSQACADDHELRAEVEAMLAADAHSGGFLEKPVDDLAADVLASSDRHFAAGAMLGSYRIEGPLGAGGMGEVFRATDTRLHRTVAIKILPRDKTTDPERKRRFMQEARAASALNHPNIVTLHDIANDSGTDYLVMEYVPGKSLDKLITPKGLPLAEAIGYAAQIASALAAAHAAGIVHRDIKPANVIVTSESQVKVLDFGIAKLAEPAPRPDGETLTQESALTETGAVMGTVNYMSPEQASARPLDHRTDIFSLGVVLYEMLAGQRPFRGESQVESLHAIIHDPVPSLPQNPPEVNDILDKALAKDPRERYQHAGDLALDLRRCQRTAPAARDTPRAQRRPWFWVAAASVLALVAGAAVAWLLRGTSPSLDNPLANAQFTRFTDFAGTENDAAISADGKFVAFRSDRDGRFDIWLSQVGTGRFIDLTKGKEEEFIGGIRSMGFSPDGAEIWLAGNVPGRRRLRLMPLMGGTPRPFLRDHAVHVAWSPDASRLVFHTGDPGDPMFVADRTGANARQIFVEPHAGGHNHFPTWSPDGQWIYFVSGTWDIAEMDLYRIAPSGGKPERLTQHHSDVRYVTPLDNRTILYVSPDQDGSGPWLWDLDPNRKVTHRVSSGLEKYLSVAASADGQRLAATVANPSASLWSVPILDRVAEERDVKPFSLPAVRALAPRLHGKSVFYLSSSGAGDGLWRYQDGQAQEVWKGADGPQLTPPAVSPDGQRAAIVLRRQGKLRLHLVSADGGEPQPLTEAVDARGAACWSPDGKWIVTGGNDAKGAGLFKVPIDGGAPVRLLAGTALHPVWSPSGSLIVYIGPVVASQSPLRAVTPDGAPVEMPSLGIYTAGERFRFLPDGKGLVYMQGTQPWQDFWLLDLATKKTRQLTHLDDRSAMRTFDITPDGKHIVFDRLRENSDIVLIELPKKDKSPQSPY